MATIAQARATLGKMGLQLDEANSFWTADGGGHATIDAIGRTCIDTDCRGHLVYDYTATRPEFWQLVIDEGYEISSQLSPCHLPIGECEFHDLHDTSS